MSWVRARDELLMQLQIVKVSVAPPEAVLFDGQEVGQERWPGGGDYGWYARRLVCLAPFKAHQKAAGQDHDVTACGMANGVEPLRARWGQITLSKKVEKPRMKATLRTLPMAPRLSQAKQMLNKISSVIGNFCTGKLLMVKGKASVGN